MGRSFVFRSLGHSNTRPQSTSNLPTKPTRKLQLCAFAVKFHAKPSNLLARQSTRWRDLGTSQAQILISEPSNPSPSHRSCCENVLLPLLEFWFYFRTNVATNAPRPSLTSHREPERSQARSVLTVWCVSATAARGAARSSVLGAGRSHPGDPEVGSNETADCTGCRRLGA